MVTLSFKANSQTIEIPWQANMNAQQALEFAYNQVKAVKGYLICAPVFWLYTTTNSTKVFRLLWSMASMTTQVIL